MQLHWRKARERRRYSPRGAIASGRHPRGLATRGTAAKAAIKVTADSGSERHPLVFTGLRQKRKGGRQGSLVARGGGVADDRDTQSIRQQAINDAAGG